MEHRQLITLRAIVDTGGFNKAADELGYAQSSITAHIKELENELGFPLFDRLGKSIALTQAGRRFLPYALEIIELYAKSKVAVNETNEPSGQLTIGATESIMIYWLPKMIMDFMEQYPKVELILKSVDYINLSAQLKKGDIDAAILVESPAWKPAELITYKLEDERLSLVQSAKKLNVIQAEKMLFTEQACSWRPIFEDYLKKEGKSSNSKVELSSIEAIKKCIQCGLGTSMLPHFTVKDQIESGDFIEIPANVPHDALAIYSAIHKDKWRSVNLDVFLNALLNCDNS